MRLRWGWTWRGFRGCLSVIPRGEAEDVPSAVFCLQAGFFLGVLPGEDTIVFSGLSLIYVLNPPILYHLKLCKSPPNLLGLGGRRIQVDTKIIFLIQEQACDKLGILFGPRGAASVLIYLISRAQGRGCPAFRIVARLTVMKPLFRNKYFPSVS